MIWARDDEIGREDWRDVEARTSSYHDAIVVLVIRDKSGDEQVIRTTAGHPFFVAAKLGIHFTSADAAGRWIAAGDLSAGSRLSLAGHRFAEIVSVRTETEFSFKAYNLTVEGFHTYFVAETLDDRGVWAHNSTICDNFDTSVDTSKGPVDILANQRSRGPVVHLNDFAIYPNGGKHWDVGTRETREALRKLTDGFAQQGFKRIRIRGVRYSGANPGKEVNIKIDIK